MTRLWCSAIVSVAALACSPRAPTPVSHVGGSQHTVQQPDLETWRDSVPAPGPPSELHYPRPEQRRLDNALELLAVRQPIQIVALVVVVRRGADSVPSGKSGLAALTARMLVEGTRSRSGDELAVAAEDLGSELSSDAGRDYSMVGMTVLKADLDQAVKLLAEVVREPAFDPQEFDRVRSEWVDGLVAERQSPERLSTLVALRLLLGPAQGAPVGGSIPDVRRLTVADLREFYRAHYAPAETAVVAVGDITADDLEAAATRYLATWHATAVGTLQQPASQANTDHRRIVIVDRPNAAQSALCTAQSLPPRDAPGHEAREVLNTVLGGMFTSRLNRNLREQHGYTYGASSAVAATRNWGAQLIMTTVDAPATRPALTEIVGELSGIAGHPAQHPVTATEVERAKTSLINAHAAQLERATDVAFDLAQLFVYDLPRDDDATYADRIRAVTRDAVLAEAREHLHPDRLDVVIVGPRQAIEPGLRDAHQTVETAHPSLLE